MTLAYAPRLLCISLATFFLVHLSLSLAVSAMARPAVRLGEKIRPQAAARRLLVLRLLPAAGAVFIVVAVCLPSYILLEPDAPDERVGLGCLAAALLGIAMWSVSIARGLRAAAGSQRFLRRCQCAGRQTRLPGQPAPAGTDTWIVDGAAPLLALGGVLHPRIVISRAVLCALSAEQLAAALRHERAHWTARDNLKRLCMLLAPGLPFAGSSRTLERGWKKFTEWAADDRAAAGSARRSCALAAALVRVARIAADGPRSVPLSPMLRSLLGDPDQLSARVHRLLRPAPPSPHHAGSRTILALSLGAILLMAAFLAAVRQPAALNSVHAALERLVAGASSTYQKTRPPSNPGATSLRCCFRAAPAG